MTPNTAKRTAVVPCIEWSEDNGRTWDVWVFYRDTQEMQCREALGRFTRLYPEWKFRIGMKLARAALARVGEGE